jgi:hypothetical protein
MRASARAVAATLLVAGCSSGTPAASGSGGWSGVGTGGASGAQGIGGAAATGGGSGSGGALPTCGVVDRPLDPVNPDGGTIIDPRSGTCNAIVVPAAWLTAVAIPPADGGALAPAGGAILDGDYDMVRWQTVAGGAMTRRTIRVFSSGAYIEWALKQPDATASTDGGVLPEAYDTTMSYGGHTATFVSTSCGGGLTIHSYGYSATGDDLMFFDYQSGFDGNGTLVAVDGYHRTCARQ